MVHAPRADAFVSSPSPRRTRNGPSPDASYAAIGRILFPARAGVVARASNAAAQMVARGVPGRPGAGEKVV
jgi:hypothetical protein